jgi:hypothetical protein
LFREVQRFRDTWLWPALLAPVVLASAFVLYVAVEVVFLDDDGIVARDAVALAICFYILKGEQRALRPDGTVPAPAPAHSARTTATGRNPERGAALEARLARLWRQRA